MFCPVARLSFSLSGGIHLHHASSILVCYSYTPCTFTLYLIHVLPLFPLASRNGTCLHVSSILAYIWLKCQLFTVIGSRWRYGYFLANHAWLTGSLLVTSRKPHLLLSIKCAECKSRKLHTLSHPGASTIPLGGAYQRSLGDMLPGHRGNGSENGYLHGSPALVPYLDPDPCSTSPAYGTARGCGYRSH